jgi:SAM-dependent methyltransferase
VTGDAAYWDSQAATFDEQPDHGLRDPQVREAWRRLLLAHLPSAPAAVADIGCGTGSLSVLLAGDGYAVTGLDSAPEMIRAARAKAAAARVSARFVTSDAASSALPEGSFNVVLSRHVLWAMPDVDAALAAWIRLLQPGGTLMLIEGRWHTGAGLPASWAQEAVLRHRRSVSVTFLDDPVLWGGPVTDERYLLVSSRLPASVLLFRAGRTGGAGARRRRLRPGWLPRAWRGCWRRARWPSGER